MKVFKLKLAPDCQFWFRGPINLTEDNPVSDLINIEALSTEDVQTIQESVRRLEVSILDIGNDAIRLEDVNQVMGEWKVSIDDLPDDETSDKDVLPEMLSITVDDEEDEEEKEEVNEPYTEIEIEDAKLFLSKNGHTVKASIKKLDPLDPESFRFMNLLLEIEISEDGNNRKSIIQILKETLK